MQMTDLKKILQSAYEELSNVAECAMDEKLSLQEIVQRTHACADKMGCVFVEAICRCVDDSFALTRNKDIVVKSKQTRKLLTAMGEIRLTRRQYFCKSTGSYFIAADEALGICRYSRIENGLQAQILSEAAQHSFGVAAANAGCSRQTAFNVIKRNPVEREMLVQRDFTKEKMRVYIEADEDHIHLNDGTAAEVKLVYVHEGRKCVGGNRVELVNPRYFATLASADDIWNDVATYVQSYYDSSIDIQLSGDGANWIRAGLEWFDHASFHLDKFHVHKSLTIASAGNKERRRRLLSLLREQTVAAENELEEVLRQSVYEGVDLYTRDNLAYLLNNYSEIDLSEDISCSAESHVSHVLSKRMSSRPMGWSIAGAERIARLRCFMYNNGKFDDLVRRKNRRVAQNKKSSKKTRRKVPFALHAYHLPILDTKLTPAQGQIRRILSKN